MGQTQHRRMGGDGNVTIKERSVPERPLWAALGIVGLFLPVVWPVTVVAVFARALGVALVVGLVWVGYRMLGRATASQSRWWSFAAWALVTGIWIGLLMTVPFPPGSGLPAGLLAVLVSIILLVLAVGGSVAIALGSYEVGRRYLWHDTRST